MKREGKCDERKKEKRNKEKTKREMCVNDLYRIRLANKSEFLFLYPTKHSTKKNSI